MEETVDRIEDCDGKQSDCLIQRVCDLVSKMHQVLAKKILQNMMSLLAETDPASVHAQYRSRLMLIGRPVTVHTADGSCSRVATAMDIDEHFRLIVRYEDGTEEHLDSGEVSIRW